MVDKYFCRQTAVFIRDEIRGAEGNEVLFFGWTDGEGRVERAEVVARGDQECVTFPLDRSFLPDVVIHNHPQGALTPSGADRNIASLTAARGVGFLIVDNALERVYAAVEPVLKKRTVMLEAGQIAGLLSAGSSFARRFQGFEERDGQKRMAELVCESFNENQIALIEAGTGIGKSIAYLIPAIQWSVRNKERVVVSTNTINLQEQLLNKDIPGIADLSEAPFSYVLMKGRGNYLCLSRLADVEQDLFSFLEDEEIRQFDALRKWAAVTNDGSLSDLPFVPDTKLWDKVSSGSETCSGGFCRFFSNCFFNRVRRKAVAANLIITNHHYLIADASLAGTRAALLPPYERAVLDEAHNLEASATSFFTRRITMSSVLRTLNLLYAGPKKKKGYLVYLQKSHQELEVPVREAIQTVTGLKSAGFAMFESVERFFHSALAETNAERSNSEYPLIEIDEQTVQLPGWEPHTLGAIGVFYRELTVLLEGLMRLREKLADDDDERATKQIDGFITRVCDTREALELFLKEDDKSHVRWIEKRRETALLVALVDVGAALKELVLGRLKNCVLTSATLTVGGSFAFIERRLGLGGELLKSAIPSPFRYDSQMAVLIPTDCPLPGQPDYARVLGDQVMRIMAVTGGRAFVLFTSYKTLNDVHAMVFERLAAGGVVAFRQGQGARGRLLDSFKKDVRSVLFGTESFWEGVDAPGETLECVVITRLPFRVPTEPVTRARMEAIRREGGNPFLNYTLPLAVIKLKQGVGRLIRKKTDSGIIVILDGRILARSYGAVFLSSLPGGTTLRGTLAETLGETVGYLTNNPLTK